MATKGVGIRYCDNVLSMATNKMASIVDEDYFKATMTIEKVTALILNKHSSMSLQRHRKAIQKITQINKNGFLLKDIDNVCKLLSIVTERLKHHEEYEEPLIKLITIFSMPFLKEKTSDEVIYSAQVIETLSLLGSVCWSCNNDKLRCEIAKAIGALYKGKYKDNNYDTSKEIQQVTESYIMSQIECSSLASCLIQSLQYTSNVSTQISLLETLVLLSTNSSKNCNSMLSVKGASLICEGYLSSSERRIQFLSVEFLWNLLENGSQIQVSKQVSSFGSIRALQLVFKDCMMSSSSQESKQFRNDVLMVVSLIAKNCSNAPFIETQFLKDICEFAKFSEFEYDSSTNIPYKLSYDEEDFEVKKVLMCLLVTLSSLPAAVKVISSQKVIWSMLHFAVANDTNQSGWSSAQFEELQLLGLSCLSVLAPLCIEDYMTCQGNTTLLLLIEWCIKNDNSEFGGHGNSFHGTGGRNTKYSQLLYALKIVMNIASVRDEWILQDLHEQGIIPLLFNLLKSFQATPGCYDYSLMIEIQCASLVILSILCENNIHRKELFGGYDGVPLLVEYIKTDISHILIDDSIHYKLLKTAIDCIWSSVIGHGSVEDVFLEQSGIFALLDVLNVCPVSIKSTVLAVLVDLCENNQKSISHVSSWSSKGDINCWSLLAKLWREEEKKLGVPREDKGTLVGTTLPLIGATQSAQGMNPTSTKSITAAIEDVSENMRAKIYALFIKIGFNHPVKSTISTEDKVTLCIIENYLDFKTGEVWYEVASELAHDKLRPSSPDQECLQEIFHCAEERAEEITRQQHELIDEQHRQDLDEEYQFYEQLRDAQLSSERAQEKEEKLLLRTSNYKHLKEAKERQLMAIDASRPSAVSLGERFHATNQSSLNVTAFCGRHITIATSPMKLLNSNDIQTTSPTMSS